MSPDDVAALETWIRGATSERRKCPDPFSGDHRIAMAFAVAALVAEGTTVIKGSSCVDISFPDFFDTLQRVAE